MKSTCKNVIDLRNQYKERFEQKHHVKLGFMSFFVKASIEALKRFPAINACIDDNDIIYHGYYDIGIAVSTERGLTRAGCCATPTNSTLPVLNKALSISAPKPAPAA